MSKSRSQLIKEIKEERKKAKANLLYVKGLTKMKKTELREIADALKKASSNMVGDEDRTEREIERLENEKDQLQEELQELENEEDNYKQDIEELEELYEDEVQEPDKNTEELDEPLKPPKLVRQNGVHKDLPPQEDSESESEEEEVNIQDLVEDEDNDELVDAEEFLKTLGDTLERYEKEPPKKENKKKEKKERKRHEPSSRREVEQEIRKVMSNFSGELSTRLKPYQRKYRQGTLNNHDIDDIVDTHNDLREDTKGRIEILMDELPEGEDLTDSFYRYVNDYFERQLQRVDRLLK
jgi:hypothetical protein